LTNIAKEVKEEILGKVKAGEKVSDLSEKYGVKTGTIYSWLRSKVTGSVSMSEFRRVKKENEELKTIVGAMSLELTKLKKRELTRTKG
jgi:uncharacterized protein YjcR